MTRRAAARSCLGCCLAASALAAGAQQQLPPVEVVGTTPLGSGLVPRDRIPANVQVFGAQRLEELDPLNVPELLNRHAGSVNVNETQGNPYQIEVNYRGFTASPLLGQPQGLSVFVDGVRVNEPFGDVVNWDLIPKAAIASIVVMPGSNPVFGLNTLGGALVVRTKSGLTDPGTQAEAGAGSWKRRSLEASHGRRLGESAHLFVAGSYFEEDGWRDFSPSEIRQVFVKGGQRLGNWSWDLALTYADNDLIGNGLVPETLLAVRRESIYTRPDQTRNELTNLALNVSFSLSATDTLAGTAYVRRLDTDTLNGDLNDDFDPPLVTESGVENRTATQTRGSGLALQWTRATRSNQLTIGASHDRSKADFEQTEAEGDLDATRAVIPAEEPEVNAAITGRSRTNSLYATDTYSLAPNLHITASGRYNRTKVETVDVGRASLGLPTTLDASATYKKFNPALGASWQATPSLTVFGGASQGNRAPSPIELGCSDPANPCVLPNALQSDPPLEQVVSRTIEAGVRGTFGEAGRWNVSLFRTQNRDDILFVSNTLAAGFFQNFGKTLRKGIELGASGRAGAFDYGVGYGYVAATFESAACVFAETNSSAETSPNCAGEDEIEVRPGDRIPNIPRHTLKLDAGFRPLEALRIGANVVAYSGQFARGNENNRHSPDGAEFNGSGTVSKFALLNLDARWRVARGWSLSAKVNNVFDRKYATSSALAENAFDASGTLLAPADRRNEQFVTPGAPRSYWVGLRYRFGGAD